MTTCLWHHAIEELKKQAHVLKLHGLLAYWDKLAEHDWPWITKLLQWEDVERKKRGLERRLMSARLGRFKPLADFDWSWPTQCDKSAVSAQDGDNALRRRIKHYARPQLLVIDELGYLSYGNRHADLLFEIVNRRYEEKSTIITTNRPFSEWSEVFPNASCVVSLVDRLDTSLRNHRV